MTMTRFSCLPAVLLTSLCLTACAGSSANYPSLAKRDAERVSGTAEPVEALTDEPPPLPGSALEERLAALVTRARNADRDFRARVAATERAVSSASASAVGSDAWTDAQVATSDLEAMRSDAMIALAELDALYADERIAVPEAPSPTALAIADARNQVETLVSQQDSELRRISGAIR